MKQTNSDVKTPKMCLYEVVATAKPLETNQPSLYKLPKHESVSGAGNGIGAGDSHAPFEGEWKLPW
jgi:hypothetical protein